MSECKVRLCKERIASLELDRSVGQVLEETLKGRLAASEARVTELEAYVDPFIEDLVTTKENLEAAQSRIAALEAAINRVLPEIGQCFDDDVFDSAWCCRKLREALAGETKKAEDAGSGET